MQENSQIANQLTLGQFAEVIRMYGHSVNHYYGHDAVKRAYSMYLQGSMTAVASAAFKAFPAAVARFEALNALKPRDIVPKGNNQWLQRRAQGVTA